MFARTALRSATMAPRARAMPVASRQLMARRAYTIPTAEQQIRQFFAAKPVPVDAYPLIAITVIMCSYATYMLSKHIIEDNDHVRWAPGVGGVKFQLPAEKQ
ncbi:hypothetical protein IAU60_003082 [Kwoniella sp. DSM 27419]